MRHPIFILAILIFGLCLALPGPVHAEDTNVLNVKVRSSALRSQPQHWSGTLAKLKFGDSLTRLEAVPGGWVKAKGASGKVGFVHSSALTEKKVVLSSKGGPSDTQADPAEIVVAGKGFNREVEKNFAAENGALNFKAVDNMEKIRVSDNEVGAFIKSGKLGSEIKS